MRGIWQVMSAVLMVVSYEQALASGPAAPVEEQYVNSVGMKMVRIKAGSFLMGPEAPERKCDSNERLVHKVMISHPFYMSQNELTVEQFRQFRGDFAGTQEYKPYVAGVSWYDAAAFCKWLSKKEGKPYRLPTEAEWEYACRAGTTTPFSSGPQSPQAGEANAWGLMNMHTGVREWCLDWYDQYPIVEQRDPVGPEYGMVRIVRGGGLESNDPNYARSAARCAIAHGFAIMQSGDTKEVPKPEEGEHRQGLIGTRFANPDFTRPEEVVVLDRPDKDWSGRNLAHDWADRYWGYIESPVTGRVTFTAEADSGLTLVVDKQTVLSGRAEKEPLSGTVSIIEGKKYPVVLSYFQDQDAENQGLSYLRLYWSWAGRSKVIVAGEALSYDAGQQLLAETDVPALPRSPGHHNIGFRIVQAPMP